jgi:hypothetical protein
LDARDRSTHSKFGFTRSGTIDNLDAGDPDVLYFKRIA